MNKISGNFKRYTDENFDNIAWWKKPLQSNFTVEVIENDEIKDYSLDAILYLFNLVKFKENRLTEKEQIWLDKAIAKLSSYYQNRVYLPQAEKIFCWREILSLTRETQISIWKRLVYHRRFYQAAKWMQNYQEDQDDVMMTHEDPILKSLQKCFELKTFEICEVKNILSLYTFDQIKLVIKSLLNDETDTLKRKILLESFINCAEQKVKELKKSSRKQFVLENHELQWQDEYLGYCLDSMDYTIKKHQTEMLKSPKLILEQWLMNGEVKNVKKSLTLLGHLKVKDDTTSGHNLDYQCRKNDLCLCTDHYHKMIEFYAIKCLDEILKTNLNNQWKDFFTVPSVPEIQGKNKPKSIPSKIKPPSDQITFSELSTSLQNNNLIRESFHYDQTSSIFLFDALVSLHLEPHRLALFCLELIHNKLEQLKSQFCTKDRKLENLSQIILDTVLYLLALAQMQCAHAPNDQLLGICDFYCRWTKNLQQLQVCKLPELLPSSCLDNVLRLGNLQTKSISSVKVDLKQLEGMRSQARSHLNTLKTNLITKGLWYFAMKISEKNVIQKNSILYAMGISTLKVRDFPTSRGVFQKILNCKEHSNHNAKKRKVKDILRIIDSPTSNITSIKKILAAPGLEKQDLDPLICQSLNNASEIAEGNLEQLIKDEVQTSVNDVECKYYLKLYGSSEDYLEYLIKKYQLEEAVEYICRSKISLTVIAQTVILPCFQRAEMEQFLNLLEETSTRKRFVLELLNKLKIFLKKNNYWNCLLELQQNLNDVLGIVEALTYLYRYQAISLSDLNGNEHYLTKAITLLDKQISLPIYNKTKKQYFRNIKRRCRFQLKFIAYLNRLKAHGHYPSIIFNVLYQIALNRTKVEQNFRVAEIKNKSSKAKLPTVFDGRNIQFIAAACLVVDEHYITDGLKLWEELHVLELLNTKEILSISLEAMVHLGLLTSRIYDTLRLFLDSKLIADKDVRSICWPTVITLGVLAPKSWDDLDYIVDFLKSFRDKIDAYIAAGELGVALRMIECSGRPEDFEYFISEASKRECWDLVEECKQNMY